MKKILISILLLSFGHARADSSNIELLLKAKGLQSLEKLEKLIKKNGDSKGEFLSKAELCEWKLLTAYAMFVNPETSKIVTRPVNNSVLKDAAAYVFVLSDDGEMKFQMNYVFAKETGDIVVASEISTIKEGWVAKVSTHLPNTLIALSKSCYFKFNLKNPLDITAEPV